MRLCRSTVALAALTALAACNKEPEVQGQVVAVVNGDEITASELRAEAEGSGADPRDPAVRSQALNAVVQRHLQATAARQIGLDKDPRFLAHRRRAEQQILAQMYLQNVRAGSSEVDLGEARTYILRNPQLFEERQLLALDRIGFTPANAVSEAEVRGVKSIAEAERLLASKGVRFDRRTALLDPADIPAEIAPRLISLPQGELFFGSAGSAAMFATVLERRAAPVPAEEQVARARALLKRQRQQQALDSTLRSLNNNAKITYQKGYGPAGSERPQKPKS